MTDDYTKRAQAHRPADVATFQREAQSLASFGLKAADVASALGITPFAAEQLLSDRTPKTTDERQGDKRCSPRLLMPIGPCS